MEGSDSPAPAEDGYGWLAYAYITEGLAVDFWSLLRLEYVKTGNFE